ncbi:hypothetical protein N566_16360 [Streptomycetaceae bacterium MP113-05]|nr:hypothetical protein N566_16360 [Streptomycetaceae bacterium MP113-05]
MLVLVAPGQGAQKPGFLTPWLDLPGVADRLREWSDALELDLVHFGTKADAEEIRDTAVAQPMLVAAALVSADALLDGLDASRVVGSVAGHSVGELAAAALAGVVSPGDAMSLVRIRGRAMAEAAAVTETGMAAVLGGDSDTVTSHLEQLGLTPANINGGGQIVAAGTAGQLAELAADKPEGARVRPLQVAGAFHTVHMAPAVEALENAVRNVTVTDPVIPYVSNADGRSVTTGEEVVSRLVRQVANPVRWDLCMETFVAGCATTLIEMCPGGTLTGLAKRSMPGVRTLALKSPDDLEAARSLVAEHAAVAE